MKNISKKVPLCLDSEDEEEKSDSSDPDDTTSKSTVVAVTMSPPLEEDEPVEIPELKSLFGLNSSPLTDQPLME